MKYDELDKTYLPIGTSRLLDIRVFLDDVEIYSGMVEDAQSDVKNLYYTYVEKTDKWNYYCYNSLQNV